MLHINELHLYYIHKGNGQRYRRILRPPSSDPASLKLALGRQLVAIEDRALYYYVVGVVTLSDGKEGFRTLIGKRMFKD